MATREQNEGKFKNWEELEGGGRRYWYDVLGRRGYKARYIKIVDANETTVKFYQEIYDSAEALVSVHEKFPVDSGHQDVEE